MGKNMMAAEGINQKTWADIWPNYKYNDAEKKGKKKVSV